jgi:hypothetical protein
MVEGSTTSEDGVHIGRCERGEGRSGGTLDIVYYARLDWGVRGWHDGWEMVGSRWEESGQRWWDEWRWVVGRARYPGNIRIPELGLHISLLSGSFGHFIEAD